MWTLFFPNWPGLSLFTHHCLAGCCGAAPPCVNTAAAPLNRNTTATASGTCKRLMTPLLWLGVQTLPQEPPAGQTDSGSRYVQRRRVVRWVGCADHGSSGHGCFG